MFEKIKQFQQNRIVKGLSRNAREKRIANIADLKLIGLVFEVGSEQDWNAIYRFVKAMEHDGKKVILIGFHPEDLELSYIFTHQQTTICHEKEDFNFWGLPKDDVIDDFIGRHYDILIDTTDQPNFFGKYISLRAEADLKITYVNDNAEEAETTESIFDLLIHGEQPIEIETYLAEVVKYLGMIKK